MISRPVLSASSTCRSSEAKSKGAEPYQFKSDFVGNAPVRRRWINTQGPGVGLAECSAESHIAPSANEGPWRYERLARKATKPSPKAGGTYGTECLWLRSPRGRLYCSHTRCILAGSEAIRLDRQTLMSR